MEFAIKALELANAATTISGLVHWLRAKGAREIRVSESGIETLAVLELARRGYQDAQPLFNRTSARQWRDAVGLGPDAWRQCGRLPSQRRRLATMIFGLDGILGEVAIAKSEVGD